MAYENKCMYCFEDLDGRDICPHCGRDSRAAVPQIQLLPGTLLHNGRFLVGRAMGQDASGIVYMAYDTKRESTLRIREYLPRDCAQRLNDGSVAPAPGSEEAFERGMQRLKASVEAVEDPKKRHFYFEENGTAYIAQRKSASHASLTRDEEEREGRSGRQMALIIGGAALAVLAVIFVVIRLLTSALDATAAPSAHAHAGLGFAVDAAAHALAHALCADHLRPHQGPRPFLDGLHLRHGRERQLQQSVRQRAHAHPAPERHAAPDQPDHQRQFLARGDHQPAVATDRPGLAGRRPALRLV